MYEPTTEQIVEQIISESPLVVADCVLNSSDEDLIELLNAAKNTNVVRSVCEILYEQRQV